MTKKVYRTAQGRLVDLGALQLQNENVRAVGNMSVNARGDLIDGYNRPIDSRNQRVNRQYNKQTSNVNSDPVLAQAQVNKSGKRAKASKSVPVPPPPEDFNDDFNRKNIKETDTLVDAINRMRQIEQDLISQQDIDKVAKGE